MRTIRENQHYQLKYDGLKNRVYVKIIGFWKSPDMVPNYVEDWEMVLKMARRGFTILADVREMKIHPQSVVELHEKTIAMSTSKGYSYTAEVTTDKISSFQVNRMYENNDVENIKFNTVEEAEDFLNRSKDRKLVLRA